jgi:hypothetical protein
MPRIELHDCVGSTYRIDSMDWEKIEAWLGEWVPRLTCTDPDIPPLRALAWPLFDPGTAKPDWPCNSRFIGELFEVHGTAVQVLRRIEEQRAIIEKKIRTA